ncbi:MAG: hypothetical protein RMY36_032800 [Nostoc sp. SerVER01]|nr:hypothetical protein [Nostoc sp. SerVER01]
MSQINKTNQINEVYKEYVKQISTQSALLAGFSFAGFTAITFDAKTPSFLIIAFGICTSISIGLELLAMVNAGRLSILTRGVSIRDRFSEHIWISLLCYWVGLFFFLAALSLLAWIKIQPAAKLVTGIAIFVGIAIAVTIYRFISKSRIKFTNQSSNQDVT